MPLLTLDRHGSGPPLAWLHGFTQTRDSARHFRTILAGRHELLTLDLPGHGTAATLEGSLPEIARLVLDVLPREPLVLGGYSFGARVALHVALAQPLRLTALVVLGASRGIEDTEQRADRRRRDESLANHLVDVGAEVFLSEWLAQPLFATLGPRSESDTRSHDAAGLARSLRGAGTGTQQWLGERLADLEVPTLALAGELDSKFVAEARAIADTLPFGSFATITGAGHAAHLEQPELVAREIEDFLA
ncbi:MAG: alpha/beta fold hydrolase [Acidimicrobiaceae bacterium]|nr:alpha/beta fold hydrolase [Acidimicrobiaceae bacterium]